MALIEEQVKLNLIPEERTNFWQFLSNRTVSPEDKRYPGAHRQDV